VLKKRVSVGETINDHGGFVMWVADARGFKDEVWLRWNADMMCAAGPSVFGHGGRAWWDLWLLFDDAAFALDFGCLAGTAGGDLACLHKLADVSSRR
jgi:hypothetical protein